MGEPYSHDATLQRLDNYLQYGDRMVFLSKESFANGDAWDNIPVIFASVTNGMIHHPDFSAVDSGNLSDEYRFAGTVTNAKQPEAGNPRLDAVLNLTDAEAELLARDGKLGISTGFTANQIPEPNGNYRLVGDVVPNHVLVFAQGACPSCFPRDAGAVFLNTVGDSMSESDNETKGLLKTLIEKVDKILFTNTADTEPTEVPADVEAELTDMENTMTEEVKVEVPAVDPRDAEIAELKNTIATMKAAEEQRAKDAAWEQMKNTLPSGFLTEEAATRAEFENNKDAFYTKLMAHKAQFANVKAEGSTVCPCKQTTEEQLKNTIAENGKKIGFTRME